MKQDKELLLKDLCSRLPYGVVVNVKGFDYDYNDKLTQIYSGVGCSIQVTTNMPYDIEQVKPYLFPLSSMTEEQKMEIKSLCDGTEIFDDGSWMSYISILGNFNFEINLAVVDWYNKNHFDYRGLIPKGLALDATGLNIY